MSANIGTLIAALVAGAAVGALYLALLWAGARALGGRRPGLGFVAAAGARAALVAGALAGGVALGAGAPEMIAALAGFVAARIVATRKLGAPEGRQEWR